MMHTEASGPLDTDLDRSDQSDAPHSVHESSVLPADMQLNTNAAIHDVVGADMEKVPPLHDALLPSSASSVPVQEQPPVLAA